MECLSFSSAVFIVYYRQRFINFSVAARFALIAVAAGISGALLAHKVSSWFLLFGYGLMMFGVACLLFCLKQNTSDHSPKVDMFSIFRNPSVSIIVGHFPCNSLV
ncbi:MAG: TSUP family transporter [Candidatus Loosdrechtia sp.]|uniref:TSUP family transporter n=1 Tax=Candidatus Loosdrechtia sp. TaxID=3101272 RepID=UPI00403AA327